MVNEPPGGLALTVTRSTGWLTAGTFTRTRIITFDWPRFGISIIPFRLATVEYGVQFQAPFCTLSAISIT